VAALEYHIGPRGTPGYTVTIAGTTQNYRLVIPAVAMVDSAGNEIGTPANPLPVSPMADAASTATVTSVAANASAVTLLAANTVRKGAASFYYDGAAILYLLEGAGVPSATNYTIKLGSGLLTYYETQTDFNGIVKGIWSAATGAVLVTERTA
jgi:hypothetical protein